LRARPVALALMSAMVDVRRIASPIRSGFEVKHSRQRTRRGERRLILVFADAAEPLAQVVGVDGHGVEHRRTARVKQFVSRKAGLSGRLSGASPCATKRR